MCISTLPLAIVLTASLKASAWKEGRISRRVCCWEETGRPLIISRARREVVSGSCARVGRMWRFAGRYVSKKYDSVHVDLYDLSLLARQ